MTTNETTYQWWYITENEGYPTRRFLAVYAATMQDGTFFAGLHSNGELAEPSTTPPKGVRLEDCYLLGDPDALAEIALDYERTAQRYSLVRKAMLNCWPNDGHYAVMAGALWRQDGYDCLTLEQENI